MGVDKILAEDILLPLTIALSAIAITQTITLVKDHKKRNNERNLVRSLLNSDFARIQELKNESAKRISEWLEKLKQKDYSEINDLITRKKTPNTFILDITFIIHLNFWDAILHSGSLIKLTKNDIKTLQAAKKYFYSVSEIFNEYRKKRNDDLTKIINSKDTEQKKKSDLEAVIAVQLKTFTKTNQSTQEVLDNVFKLKWMDPDIDF